MFYLRIFFYGLIVFVPQGRDGVTALLVNAAKHISYLTFSAADIKTCDPVNCMAQIDSNPSKFNSGFNLSGVQIDIPLVPTQGAFGSAGATLPLPASVQESSALSWVPIMSEVLGTPAKIDPDCMTPPFKCNGTQGLAARISLGGGTLTTCHLVEHCSSDQSQMEVHPFHFFDNVSNSAVSKPDQALADIIEYQVQLSGSDLSLNLTDFQGKPAGSVTLKPHSCGSGKCIDLFLAVMPPKTQKCDPRLQGDHFRLLYDLIKPAPSIQPIPFKVMQPFKLALDVQPVCTSLPVSVLNEQGSGILGRFRQFVEERRARSEMRDILNMFNLSDGPGGGSPGRRPSSGPGFPNSRPICPMAIVDQ